jgi:hypothetical protein
MRIVNLIFGLILAALPSPCTYVDQHGYAQRCELKNVCGPNAHLHSMYRRYKDSKGTPQMGDGECFANVGDKWIGKPSYEKGKK